jgi:chromosome segregation protein
MILSGPSEIKNLIDEASGVKTYYIRRDRTLRRLEQTAQNLMRAEDLIKELEPRVKSLRRQAQRMEAREAIEQELKEHRRQSLAGQYWQLRRQSETVAGELAALRKQARQETEKKVDDLKTQLGQAQAKHEQAKLRAAVSQKTLAELERQLQDLYKRLEQPQAVDWKASQEQLIQLDKSFSALLQSFDREDVSALRQAAQSLIELWQKFRQDWGQSSDNQISLDELKRQLVTLSAKKDEITAQLNQAAINESEAKLSADFLGQQLTAAQAESGASSRDRQTALEIEKAKVDTHLETIVADIRQILGDDTLQEIVAAATPPQPVALEVLDKINKLQHQLDLIGGIDELTLQEYRETEARYTNLTSQVADLQKSVTDLRSIMDELDEHIKTKFNAAFHKINAQFENYFRVLFNGGRAYLSLVKAGDDPAAVEAAEELEAEDKENGEAASTLRPEEKLLAKYERGSLNVAGVDIRATPPNKKLSTIQALSGGERALTSIALLCSLLACFPSPFVVLDEVDAALDEANTIRFGQILGTLAHQTQFITITHNRETMAQSNTLYGVTMGDDGISKLLGIKLEQAKIYAK